MADEATIYHEEAVAVEGVCEPDSLVIGDCVASEIKISVAGEYKRGTLLMSNGENAFIPATSAGLGTATEICLLTRKTEVPEDNTVYTSGYFRGIFNPDAIILPYETESDTHSELIDAIKLTLRSRSIFIN